MTTKTDQWQAVIADDYGYVVDAASLTDGSYYAEDVPCLQVVVVRGTAAPVVHDDDDPRLPGTWAPEDRAGNFDGFDLTDEVSAKFLQAQAMAAGLNGAAK